MLRNELSKCDKETGLKRCLPLNGGAVAIMNAVSHRSVLNGDVARDAYRKTSGCPRTKYSIQLRP